MDFRTLEALQLLNDNFQSNLSGVVLLGTLRLINHINLFKIVGNIFEKF